MGLFDRMKAAQKQASEAMSNTGGLKGMMASATPTSDQAAYAQLANKLRTSGVEAPAVINAIRPSGNTEIGGGQQTDVDVTITPAGGEAYQTTVHQSFLASQLEGLSEGKQIGVKYDSENPSAALIYSW